MEIEETALERKRRLHREATARYREKHRSKKNAYQREYRKKLQFPPCSLCGLLTGKPDAKICYRCFRGENHPTWKGGRYINTQGYVVVIGRQGEAGMMKNGYILEHRRVMQDHLGRPLLKTETVHHINGIRSDNRLENLELWVSRQPPGQRVDQLVAWAKEILNRYEKECREKWVAK